MSLSRIVIAATALGVAIPLSAATPDTLETYQKLTSVEPRCVRPSSDRDILVCGARRADRWRVPFVGYELGDPRGESVEGERKRISDEHRPPCGRRAIIADCGGGVGVSVSTRMAGDGLKLRQLAP
ncbi:hypothetical protein [Sphingomonas sp. SUN039]|uniref:hypothetical protein n=1 Tax=Sphingomonas sp. SUN039 TaxID=2937787 RepID=UPI002164DECD|nr:hypothetical protein [Sphingomonas sp. SUN039]UVO55710.1 hypothetical protein M0209_16920 [Sphingomonas sp. SUN039]